MVSPGKSLDFSRPRNDDVRVADHDRWCFKKFDRMAVKGIVNFGRRKKDAGNVL